MKRVIIVCSASLTSSLLSSRLQKYSNENGLDLLFQPLPYIQLKDMIVGVDCVLLTPQVRFSKNEITAAVNKTRNVPVALIDVLDYDQSNVESICNLVLSIIKE